MNYKLSSSERLKSRKLIEKLYREGKVIKIFPLCMVYIEIEHKSKYPIKAGFSVAKRNFKRAVDRNRIKRLLRECYRLNKNEIYSKLNKEYIFMISYIANDYCDYSIIKKKITKILLKFVEKVSE